MPGRASPCVAYCAVDIGPNLARTLVELGVDLDGLRTDRTLQDGLVASLGRAPTIMNRRD